MGTQKVSLKEISSTFSLKYFPSVPVFFVDYKAQSNEAEKRKQSSKSIALFYVDQLQQQRNSTNIQHKANSKKKIKTFIETHALNTLEELRKGKGKHNI